MTDQEKQFYTICSDAFIIASNKKLTTKQKIYRLQRLGFSASEACNIIIRP